MTLTLTPPTRKQIVASVALVLLAIPAMMLTYHWSAASQYPTSPTVSIALASQTVRAGDHVTPLTIDTNHGTEIYSVNVDRQDCSFVHIHGRAAGVTCQPTAAGSEIAITVVANNSGRWTASRVTATVTS